MQKLWLRSIAPLLLLAACGDDGGGGGGPDAKPRPTPLFEPQPECQGAAVTAFAGSHTMVVSQLAIGTREDGFDLDRDGRADNKLAGVGGLAQSAINDTFRQYGIVLPLEFFDLPTLAVDSCVKFAIYAGQYAFDADGDNSQTARDNGECDDGNPAANGRSAEIPGNFRDDDCDGLADENPQTNAPSTDAGDRDKDGVTVAGGDCNDTDPMVKGRAFAEICGDGKDNNCDGRADRAVNGEVIACNPFDMEPNPENLKVDPLSLTAAGAPLVSFTSGSIAQSGTKLQLKAGPGFFTVGVPLAGLTLNLGVTGAQVEATLVEGPTGMRISEGRLGGVIDAITAENVRGLSLPDIGLRPENSLLDATFANVLGMVLSLPLAPEPIRQMYGNCRSPDIDVDQDGPEIFCDSAPDDDNRSVDVCIDGDGTVVRDMPGPNGSTIDCTTAMDADGNFRFVDGVSVAFTLSTVPAGSLSLIQR